jgi:hypothetical protein
VNIITKEKRTITFRPITFFDPHGLRDFVLGPPQIDGCNTGWLQSSLNHETLS